MAARKPKKSRKKASPFPWLTWPRSPVQRPHSTPKGKRGYDRKRAKKSLRREVDEPGP